MDESDENGADSDEQIVDGVPEDATTAVSDELRPDGEGRINAALAVFKTKFRRHLFTFVAIAVVLALLYRVSQVRNIIFQFPEDPWQRWGFIGTLLFIAGIAVVSIFGFVWPSIMEPKNTIAFRTIGLIPRITLNWLNVLASKLSSLGTGVLGYAIPGLMAIAGVGWLMFLSTETNTWQPWPLASGFARMLAVSVFWIGIWLLFGRWLNPKLMTASKETAEQSHRFDDTRRRQRLAWQVSGRVLAFLTLTLIIGELLWIAAMWRFPLASLRLYSVWAIFEIASIGVLVCALIDYLDHHTLWPWRLTSVISAFVVIWLTGPHRIDDSVSKDVLKRAVDAQSETVFSGQSVSVVQHSGTSDESESSDSVESPSTTAKMHPWYSDLETRIDAIPDGPAVFVAASGGGSRAALFAAMVLDMLHEEPMRVPLIDDESIPPPPDPDESDPASPGISTGTWGDHILSISCVSGGTLASARYVQLSSGPLPQYDHPKMLRYTDFYELVNRCNAVFDSLIKQTTENDADNLRELKALAHAQRQLEIVALRYPAGGVSGSQAQPDTPLAGADPLMESVFRSKFIDEMCIDFMAPILRGVLVPLEPRGQSLYQFWNTEFGWTDISQSTWRRHWDPKSQPMLLVNATDIDHGRRMVIGYPALPPKLLPAAGVLEHIEFDDTAGSVRTTEYSPYSFSSINSNSLIDITLGRAVRISSSFPFGFRPSSVAVPDPTDKKPDQTKVLHYLDGGIVDNTGLDTFDALFQSLAREADRGDNPTATRLMGKLRQRGVILIEIDSGAKPSSKSTAADPFRIITQPVGALESASYTTALRTSDHYLTQIARLLTDDHSAFLARGMLHSVDEEVLSSVGLDPTDKKQIGFISGSLSVLQQSPKDPTCKTDRLTCNSTNLDDQVMTSFALGPQGKARVISQFLVQRHHWRGALQSMGKSYQKAVDARRKFSNDSRSIELSFTRLIETSGRWVDQLESEMDGDTPPDKDEIRERLKVPMALMIAAGKLAEDTDLEREIERNQALKRMISLVQSGRAIELFAHFVPRRTSTTLDSISLGPEVAMNHVPVPSEFDGEESSDRDTKPELKAGKTVLWNDAVAQAKQISQNVSPVQAYEQSPIQQQSFDPFEQNKMQRQQSGRDFYQAK